MTDWIKNNRWPIIVGLAAVLVRLVVLIEFSQKPGFTVPMVDEKWHWEWADQIIHTSFWGDEAWFRAPLYMYFLALLRWITGGSIFWAKLLQLIVCFGTAFFTCRLAERLFNRRTAILAGLMYACYGTLLLYETLFLIPVVFMFFLVWGMDRVVAHRDTNRFVPWLVTGLVFGLAAISRPNVLLVIPFLLLWLYLIRRRLPSLARRVRTPLALLVGVVLAVAPVTVRNYVVTGDFMLISSQGGVNLYIGNNPYANGLTMVMPEVDLQDESLSWRDFIPLTERAAEREAGRNLSPVEQSAFWTDKAVDFVLANPGMFLELVWKKTIYLLSGVENSDNMDVYYQRTKSLVYSVLLWRGPVFLPFGVLLPLALMGVYLRRKDTRRLAPLYLFILAYSPSIVLFLVTARHRLPLVPFLIIIAAAGIMALVERWRRIRRAELLTAAVILFPVAIVFNQTYYGEKDTTNEFQIHFNEGIKYERVGDLPGAEREYLQANSYFPNSAPLLNNLGHVQYQLGKLNEAERNYRRAIALKPDYGRAYNNLGLVVRDRGNLDSALTLFRLALQRMDTAAARPDERGQVFLNLGDIHEQLGNLDSASRAFRQASVAAPDMADAYFKAAAFFARYEQYQISDSLFAAGRHLRTPGAADYFNWGLSYVQRRQFSFGLAMLRRALRQEPDLYQAHYLVAVCHLEGGSPPDSVNLHLNRSLELNPSYEPALELRKTLR